MREMRFFVRDENVKHHRATLSTEESHHLKNVLRLKPGDPVIVFTGKGEEFQGNVLSLGAHVVIALEKKRRDRIRGEVSIVLVQALPKKKKMDFIISKACELGAEEIIPIETEHTEIKLSRQQAERVAARWERIAVQSCKQSRLDWIPEIRPLLTFRSFLNKTKDFTAVLIPHPDASMPKLSELTAELKTHISKIAKSDVPRKIAVVVGPEGGFSEKEIQAAREAGAYLTYFGDVVLRTETASIVAVSLVKYAFNLC